MNVLQKKMSISDLFATLLISNVSLSIFSKMNCSLLTAETETDVTVNKCNNSTKLSAEKVMF
jgi:hypothetical protein